MMSAESSRRPDLIGYLKYEKYIEFIKVNKNASADTIANYQNAMKTCQMEGFDPVNILAVWKALLDKLNSGTSYGAVRNMLIVTKAILNLHGIPYPKDYNYHELVAKLAKAGSIPGAYNEEQLRQIFKVCQKEDWNLFRLSVIGTYSGVRIGGTKPLKFTDFTLVDPFDVYVYTVTSKQRTYVAAISGYAYRLLADTNFNKSEYVIERDPGWKDYENNYRARFILQKNALLQVLEGKQPFNGMRKFFLQQLANCGLHDEDIGLLKGVVPKSIAWKRYINSTDGGLYPRIARLYSETPLMTLRLV